MSVFLYAFGALLRIVLSVIAAPLLVVGSLLALPVVSNIWGYWVWFCQLLGGAGEILLSASRYVAQAGVMYVPFYVVRRLVFRKTDAAKTV